MATTVNLGGRDLMVLPLNLRNLRELTRDGRFEALALPEGKPTAAYYEALVAICVAAIQRTHHEVDAAWIEENTTIDDLSALVGVVLAASGLKSKEARDPEPPSP